MVLKKLSCWIIRKARLKKNKARLKYDQIFTATFKNFSQGGDDRLLSFLIKELELMKFEILNIKEFLLNYFPSHGNITKIKPTKIASSDIRIGKTILDNLSPMDVGQAIIIQQGDVLGIEAVEGTDNLIKRTKKFIKNGEKPTLIKLKKKTRFKSRSSYYWFKYNKVSKKILLWYSIFS